MPSFRLFLAAALLAALAPRLPALDAAGAPLPPALRAPAPQGQVNLALNKPATQSSTYSAEFGAGVCVDGNRTAGLCHTNSEANPWWQVDLGANYALSRIVVYNRSGTWGSREHTLRVLLSPDGQNWTAAWTNNGGDFEVQPVNTGGRTARYVRLQLAATDYLNLQEVEVYGADQAAAPLPPSPTQAETNLALNKTATQSSTYSAEFAAGACVDGNRTEGLCHTQSEANPWWQVDLGANHVLSRIVVYNRTGAWGSREHTLHVLLSTDGQNWTTTWANLGGDFEVQQVNAGNRTARYVRLQLAATDFLNLQEVEVYGAYQVAPALTPSPTQARTNLALNKTATQSTTYAAENAAGVCVDGNRATGLCHTNSEANPWWQVDLGANYPLSQIVVYNRSGTWGSREHTLRVLLSTDGQNWTTAWANNGSDFEVLPVNTSGRTARYVRLQLAATDYLNLQEVEVYGAGTAP